MCDRRKDFKKVSLSDNVGRVKKLLYEHRKDNRERAFKIFRNSVYESEAIVNTASSNTTCRDSVFTHTIGSSDAVSLDVAICNIKSGLSSGLDMLKCLMCSSDPPIQEVIDEELVPFLVHSLLSLDNTQKSQALWCLANIATGDHEQTGYVLTAVPTLLQLLGGDNPILQEQACWVLGNIAVDSDEYRSILISNGTIKPLYDLLVHSTDITRAKSAAAWTLSNLARGSISARCFIDGTNSVAVTSLIQHLDSEDISFSTEIAWIFAFLSAKDEDAYVAVLVQYGLIAAIVYALNKVDIESPINIPFVRCLGNLSSGPIEWLSYFFVTPQIPLFDCLLKLISPRTNHRVLLKESIWVLSNILGGDSDHIKAIVSSSLFARLLEVFLLDQFDLQREALRGICNSIRVPDIVSLLARDDVYVQLLHLLKVADIDVVTDSIKLLKVLNNSCISAKRKLHELGILDALDEIQYTHGNIEIMHMACSLSDDIGDWLCKEEEEAMGTMDETSAFHNLQTCSNDSSSISSGFNRGAGRGSHLVTPAWMT